MHSLRQMYSSTSPNLSRKVPVIGESLRAARSKATTPLCVRKCRANHSPLSPGHVNTPVSRQLEEPVRAPRGSSVCSPSPPLSLSPSLRGAPAWRESRGEAETATRHTSRATTCSGHVRLSTGECGVGVCAAREPFT